MQDSNADRSRGAALDRIERTESGVKLAIAGAAVVEALLLALFVVLADFGNRVHALIFIGSCLVYFTLALGLVALGAHVTGCTRRILKAIELLDSRP